MRQLRIVSNGTPSGTKVYTEDGEEITGITDLRFSMSMYDMPQVELTIMGAIMTLDNGDIGEVSFQCPGCGETASHKCHAGDDRKGVWVIDQ